MKLQAHASDIREGKLPATCAILLAIPESYKKGAAVERRESSGQNESNDVAMAIKPYIHDRKAHWQSVYASGRPTDASNGTESTLQKSEQPADMLRAVEAQVPKEGRKAKRPVRRNQKYERIYKALREFAAARPKGHEEVLRLLDVRKVAIPNRRPFKVAGGWLKGFEQNRHEASAWLSQAWGRLDLPAFSRGLKKVVIVTTFGDNSCRTSTSCQ